MIGPVQVCLLLGLYYLYVLYVGMCIYVCVLYMYMFRCTEYRNIDIYRHSYISYPMTT